MITSRADQPFPVVDNPFSLIVGARSILIWTGWSSRGTYGRPSSLMLPLFNIHHAKNREWSISDPTDVHPTTGTNDACVFSKRLIRYVQKYNKQNKKLDINIKNDTPYYNNNLVSSLFRLHLGNFFCTPLLRLVYGEFSVRNNEDFWRYN